MNQSIETSSVLNHYVISDLEWINFNWKAIENRVKFLRYRIFNASRKKDFKTVTHLQQIMLNSSANILLAIRRVTAINRQLSGIDKIRIHLIQDLMLLDFSTYKPITYNNLIIPKTHRKQKLLKIQIIKDQCIQLIIKHALEPQWEAYFEDNVYGERPGRSSHDAISHIIQIIKLYSTNKWVLNIDLSSYIFQLNGEVILKKLRFFPRIDLIFRWLKAGYITKNVYFHTTLGLPQGDIITSLLANIALDDLDKVIKMKYSTSTFNSFYVRYNGAIAILVEKKDTAHTLGKIISGWCINIGFNLDLEQISKTFIPDGFNFLTVYIYSNAQDNRHLSVIPNEKAIKDIRDKLKNIWMRGRGKDILWVLDRLNPRIREWCNYYCFYKSSQIFKDIDNWMFQRSVRYCKRTHPNKSWTWMQQKYFGRFNIKRKSKWIFGDKESSRYLTRFSWTISRQYIPIQIQASPDNMLYEEYWCKRNATGITNDKLWNSSDFKIAQRQKHICPVCNNSLYNQEPIEKHKIVIKKSTSRLYTFNMIFIHSICYQCIKYAFKTT
uniref:Maturase n=1 Tax=Bangiopsis subsimplex TaxID=139980 RepID=A0A1C9CCS4_9RHOD|nr:maturase [Bangiopsis subsimplex]AOM66175.1 maturase [Bangiopsis subsimplex]ARO90466.1 putative reverse transcriptase/maturase [Bangiopsis subsimplex]